MIPKKAFTEDTQRESISKRTKACAAGAWGGQGREIATERRGLESIKKDWDRRSMEN